MVIPARDEAGAIATVVRRVLTTLPAEVIVVDNNSRDGTATAAAAAGARVVVEPARGYGYACLAGIAAATRPDVIVFIDGDGSMAPEEIPRLLEPIASDQADIVCGSRRTRAAAGSMPGHQAFGNWLSVTLLRLLYGVRLTDLGPFRAVRASTLRSLQVRPTRFAFLAEMLARAARSGARITEIEVGYQPRIAGRSKVGGSLRGSVEAGSEIIGSLISNRVAMPSGPWLAGLGASLTFFFLAWIRYASFRSTAYDLGFFDQVVWNAAQGHGLSSSFLSYSFFGQHFEPALLLFVPFYAFHATPLWLLLGQSLALGLAVVPLFALALQFFARRSAWLIVIAYLLQLAVSRTVAFDFHTEALATPFVFLALLGLQLHRPKLFLVAALVPLLCKEDGALLSLALGLFAFFLFRKRTALFLSAVALALGALVLLVIMPAYRGGRAGDLIGRYQYLGASPGEVLLHAVTQPGVVISHLAASGALPALAMALIGLGLLPLRRPGLLLIAVIPLAPALLSGDQGQATLAFHYGIGGVPLLLVGALLGLRRLAEQNRLAIAAGVLVVGAVAVFIALSPLPATVRSDLPDLSRSGDVEAVLDAIPASASVSASTSLVPHLAERRTIDELPCGVGNAAWIAVDQRRSPSSQSTDHGYAVTVARLPDRGYQLIKMGGGVTLWHSPAAESLPPAVCYPSG